MSLSKDSKKLALRQAQGDKDFVSTTGSGFVMIFAALRFRCGTNIPPNRDERTVLRRGFAPAATDI